MAEPRRISQPGQKYIDFCYSHEAHPIKNHQWPVPSLSSCQERGLRLHRTMLFVKHGLIFTADQSWKHPPILEGLEVTRGEIHPHLGLEGVEARTTFLVWGWSCHSACFRFLCRVSETGQAAEREDESAVVIQAWKVFIKCR